MRHIQSKHGRDAANKRLRNYSVVKRTVAVIPFLVASFAAHSDPHFVQVLHPYWGSDEYFMDYMKDLNEPVNGYVTTYEGSKDPDDGSDTHLYFYAVNTPGATTFSLDLSCPENEYYQVRDLEEQATNSKIADIFMVDSDPVHKNPAPSITSGNSISWPLDATGGKQGMWFYSPDRSTERTYTLTVVDADGKQRESRGTLEGPSCPE